MHLFLCIAFFMPVAAATTTELKRSSGGTLRYLVAVPRRFDRLVGLEARESTVVEMPAIFQAGAKMQLPSLYICGGIALDCCWQHLGIQAGGICRRACRTVTYLFECA
jgi:hypothetical protein